jgi:hypothetical protein
LFVVTQLISETRYLIVYELLEIRIQ